ncbi:MAG TPA: RNA methyltransferase [Prolixibacteraceae bacterium]|nr:RNA methyltransferase [Prolixibacteraceae bacterium]
MNQELIHYLSNFISDERFALFEQVLMQRTRYITVVLEDIFQSHNASAVLRTCDCFGVQDVHIIENRNKFNENIRVTRGSDQWLSMYYYNQQPDNTLSAIQSLKEDGYKIVATSPHSNDVDLADFDLTSGKIALVFGTEKRGISEVVKHHADSFLKIPMQGFTESLNISVSVAIILHYLTKELRNKSINWKLTDQERELLLIEWLRKSIKSGDLLIKNFGQVINV